MGIFNQRTSLSRGFLLRSLMPSKSRLKQKSEQLGEILEKYGSVLSMASVSFFAGAAAITPGAGMQELGKQLSAAELDDLKTRMEIILREANKKVVILIDDIDRLDRGTHMRRYYKFFWKKFLTLLW